MNDLRRLQRKLIPVNLIVAIISLVAAISIIFAPLLTINVGEAGEFVSSLISDDSDEEQSEDISVYIDTVLNSVGDIKFSLTTYGIAKFAFSKDPLDRIVKSVADEIKKIEEDLFATVAVNLIPQFIDSIDDLDIDAENIDVKEVLNKFDDVLKATSNEQVDQSIEALVDEIQRQAVSKDGENLITDDMKGDIQDMIKQFYDDAKETLGDEDLTLESFICVTLSKFLNNMNESSPDASAIAAYADAEGEESSEGGSGKIYTNYNDLIKGMLGIDSEGSDAVLDGLSDMLDMFMLIPKIFAIAMFFFAGIWFIQFLFAFFHMFAKNKRFLMWYTKLWGLTPCFIFGILPLLAGWIIPMIIPEATAVVGGILGTISTLTWISGGCYLLLWIISIFWAFPIKRKIRKLLKNGATYND